MIGERAETRALQALDTDACIKLAQDLVRVPSVTGNERAVQDLPLNGRNFIRLAQLSMGANEDGDNALQSGNRPDVRWITFSNRDGFGVKATGMPLLSVM